MVANASGVSTYVYDLDGQPRRVTNGANRSVTYAWDAVGQRQYLVTPDNERFTYTHDALGRMTRLSNPQNEITTWAYDNNSRTTSVRRGNGTRTSFTFDSADQVTDIVHLKSDNSVISSFKYTYNSAGNRRSVAEADGSRTTWTYDNANQLRGEIRTGTGAVAYTNTFDAVGNRTRKDVPGDLYVYDYDKADQITRAVSLATISTFTFDAAGNQTRERNIVYTTTLVWDDENRVVRNRTTSPFTPGVISRTTLTYDGDGMVTDLKQHNGTVIRPVYDGQNILLEQGGSNATQTVYTSQPNLYGNLISFKRGAAKSYFHYNAIGTTDRLTDGSQSVTDSYLLDAWGAVTSGGTGSTVNPFKFIGELGYYNYPTSAWTSATWVRARHYEPIFLRWLSEDPFSRESSSSGLDSAGVISIAARSIHTNDPLAMNAPQSPRTRQLSPLEYIYCFNSPSLYVDPNGKHPVVVIGAGASVLALCLYYKFVNGLKYINLGEDFVHCYTTCKTSTGWPSCGGPGVALFAGIANELIDLIKGGGIGESVDDIFNNVGGIYCSLQPLFSCHCCCDFLRRRNLLR